MRVRHILFLATFLFFIIALVRFITIKAGKIKKNVIINTLQTTSKFGKTIIDVGVHKFNVPVEANFVVYNTGDHALYIQKAEPDCHCSKAIFSHEKIPPHDSTIVKLIYDALNLGPFQSTALVTTNSTSSPTLLIFRGSIEQ